MKAESAKLKALRQIAAKAGGVLNPEDVVDFARPARSPLHNSFEWDDTEAAQQYRLWQARHLINVMVTMLNVGGEQKPVRVFVSLTTDREEDGGYREMNVVLRNTDWRTQMLDDALAELAVFEQKYAMLLELSEIFDATKRVKKKAV